MLSREEFLDVDAAYKRGVTGKGVLLEGWDLRNKKPTMTPQAPRRKCKKRPNIRNHLLYEIRRKALMSGYHLP